MKSWFVFYDYRVWVVLIVLVIKIFFLVVLGFNYLFVFGVVRVKYFGRRCFGVRGI